MTPFAAGVSVVFASLMGALWWLDRSIHWYEPNIVVMLIVGSILAPTLAAWIVAEFMNVMRARWMFDRRVARLIPRFLAGLGAGLIGACAASLLLAVADDRVHDVLILTGSAAMGAALVLVPMRRVKPGACVHCGYDIRSQPAPGQPGWGVCPECGASVGAGRRACAAT